jgi:hypothetical protein
MGGFGTRSWNITVSKMVSGKLDGIGPVPMSSTTEITVSEPLPSLLTSMK